MWPSLNSSTIQLLGLFSDAINTSEPTTVSVHSRAMFKAAIILSQRYNITIDGKYIEWQTIQTGGDLMNSLSSTCRILPNSSIVGIVGPSFSREAEMIATFADSIGLPVISYSATAPDLSDRIVYPAFYRTVPSDNAAAFAMVELFNRYNWTSCIIIYQNDVYGFGGARIINEIFNKHGLTVSNMIIFDIRSLNVRGDLKRILVNSPSRIVILWTAASYTRLILESAFNFDVLGPRFTWILSVSDIINSFNWTVHQKLVGMLSLEPVTGSVVNAPINTTLLKSACDIWQQYEPESFPGVTMIDYYALFAFDATWSFIQALQQCCCCPTALNNSLSDISIVDSSYCFDRHFFNGNKFIHTISTVEFLGISGLIQYSSNVTDRINGNYHVVKNFQSFSNGLGVVPVLVWSDLHTWQIYTETNVILWPGNTLSPPTGRADMIGVTLRIAVIEIHPFTMTKNVIDDYGRNSTKLIGYFPDLIDLLVSNMNFIPQIILVPSNQTYNSLIDAVANGVYDMVVADMTITATRREEISFSSSIFDNSLRIITRIKSAEEMDLMAFLRPLSLKLWIVLLVSTLCSGFLICLFERQDNPALQHRSFISLGAMSAWYSFGTIVGYGADFTVTTAAGRLVTIGLYILSLVIVATYTANLASDLTTSKTKDIISGIDDIKNGKLSYNRIGILVDSSIEEYYLRDVSGGIHNFYPIQQDSEIYSNLINNIIDAAIMDAGVLEYATSSFYCNLTLVGTDFDQSAFGIAIPKRWLYAEDLDINILLLRESGDLDDLKRKWFQGITCSIASDIITSTTIESMSGLFVTFITIIILSLFTYIWKKCYGKVK
ncbi:unnamed protein product [Adineta steineri]|uniref:Ionotropic glutamate receptor C-terminal domain-containing protein n=1 Tax=Adineta steineri TaxID=433720 RepID=A0A815ZYE1_9BILA|nr:unnamed protein product [Adineta steineri]CAF1589022.1 unnamed protein product [Adineta steineri]